MSVDPSLVVAVAGAATAITGAVLSRRGQRDTADQQKTAAAIAEQSLELTTWQGIAKDREGEIASLRAESDRQRRRADMTQDRHDKDRERFQAELDRERDDSQRRIHALAQTVNLLRLAVLDEAKAEAAKDVIADNVDTGDLDAILDDREPL